MSWDAGLEEEDSRTTEVSKSYKFSPHLGFYFISEVGSVH